MRVCLAITAALLAGVASSCGTRPASHESGRIVYEVDDLLGPKPAGLYVVDADGDHRTRLTGERVTARNSSPVWSPDGSEIAFVSTGGSEDDWRSTVHLIRADGKGERRLSSASITGPLEWSPDGKALLAAGCCEAGPSKILLLSLGQEPARTIAEGRDAAWSPDGSRIAFVRDHGEIRGGEKGYVATPTLNSVRRDGTDLRRLYESSSAQGMRVGAPVWAPDGQSILIPESDDIMGGQGRVWQIPAGGGRGVVVARAISPVFEDLLTVSPDGKLVAFASEDGIEIVSLASGQRTAAVNIGESAALAWSPDGKALGFLAYLASPEDDQSSLYIVKPDGSDRRMISTRGDSVSSFDWRPEAASD